MSSPSPNKAYGQHFLTDERIAQRIIDSLSDRVKTVIEVGPGKGILTQFLIQQSYPKLILVEIDERLVGLLQDQYPDLRIEKADILEYDFGSVSPRPIGLIGNFPYNISSQIIFRMLDYKEQITEMVGMFQREVAQRLSASPGSKIYGITSVLLQTFYEVELLYKVSPAAFKPQPEVHSAVIRAIRNERTKLPCSEAQFRKLVKTAFQHRRKMLRNTIQKLLDRQYSAKFAPYMRKRPEQLSVDEFIELSQYLKNH